MSAVQLGPWPLGIDNVHSTSHRVYQVPADDRFPRSRLREAMDVDLDDEGWPSTRPATVEDTVLTSGEGLFAVGGRLLYQDDGTLYEGETTLVEGLTRRVSLCSHGLYIYGSDGATNFRLGDEVTQWGLPVPVGAAEAAEGTTIAAGTYLVQLTYSDEEGNEGGASDIVSVTLSETGAISVDLDESSVTTGVEYVNVYVGEKDQEPVFVSQVGLDELPHTVTGLQEYSGDVVKTAQLGGPPASLDGLVSHRAFILAWRDNVVFRGLGHEPELFDYENIMQFPGDVKAVESVTTGIWVATAVGIYWVSGDNPETWIPIKRSNAVAVPGSMMQPGILFPELNTEGKVAFFVTDSGLMVGLSNGTLRNITQDRYSFPTCSRANFEYVDRDGLRQVLIALED